MFLLLGPCQKWEGGLESVRCSRQVPDFPVSTCDRLGVKISAELEKDAPCKGVVSRELLDLERKALELDYGATERKLGLLRSSSFEGS